MGANYTVFETHRDVMEALPSVLEELRVFYLHH